MPKPPIYKSSNSMQNVILLLLFVVGLFVLYRYVKTVENETKILQNNLIELTERIQLLINNNNACMKPLVQPQSHTVPNVTENVVQDSDDTVSIQSEDITKMLKKVMGVPDDDEEDDDEIIQTIVMDIEKEENDEESVVKIDDITNVDDEDDIIITNKQTTTPNLSESLMKKTNEELKNMLKVKSLSTKGTKSELVERLLTNM